ncbi:hypothetical protein F2Q68_00006279 [Brassica cretica]|uniref:Uncharacterized protein n=1 Tax=Brassica cretica TaxID=69181 RepID=A0A8S9JKW1_BRACR|nr:hypothetical protein F2Q68_00006279 [Brassica cretica]
MAEARMVTKEDLSGFYVLTTTEQIQVFFLPQGLTKFCKSFCPNKFYGSISPPYQGTLGFPKLLILEISDNEYDGSLPSTYFINWKASSLTMNDDGGIYMEAHMGLYFLRRQNKLEGQIPETIEGCSGYTQLVEQHFHRPYSSVFRQA